MLPVNVTPSFYAAAALRARARARARDRNIIGIHSNRFARKLLSQQQSFDRPFSRSRGSEAQRYNNTAWMPLATTRLEILQVRKLIQCVRQQDSAQIAKLVELGIYGVIDYQGKCVQDIP